jgi:hypothetical protein
MADEKFKVPYIAEATASVAGVVGLALLLRDENMARIVGTLSVFPLVMAYKSKLAARTAFTAMALSIIGDSPWPGVIGGGASLVAYLTEYAMKPRRNYDHKEDDGGEIH